MIMSAFAIATMLYAFTMSITPGPTNILMMTTGVNHGFKSTVAFATGAAFGFSAMVISVALGFGVMLTENIMVMRIFGYVGAALIAYMGLKIALSRADLHGEKKEKPGFIFGAVLQWLNPKSWIACLAGVSAFNLAVGGSRLALYMSVYTVVGYLCVLSWGLAGAKISHFLRVQRNLRIFNYVMGGSLIIVALYLAVMDKSSI